MSTMEQVTQQEKRPSTMQVFMQGAGKGLNVVVKSMLPAIVMAYAVITILATKISSEGVNLDKQAFNAS